MIFQIFAVNRVVDVVVPMLGHTNRDTAEDVFTRLLLLRGLAHLKKQYGVMV